MNFKTKLNKRIAASVVICFKETALMRMGGFAYEFKLYRGQMPKGKVVFASAENCMILTCGTQRYRIERSYHNRHSLEICPLHRADGWEYDEYVRKIDGWESEGVMRAVDGTAISRALIKLFKSLPCH